MLNGVPVWLPLLLLLPVLILVKRLFNFKGNLPPGPPSLPIIGNLHQLGSLPHRSLKELSKKYGPVVMVKLGSVPTVVVHSPESAQEILKVHDIECCTRPNLRVGRKLFYNRLDLGFSPFGDYYKDVRKLCVLELFSTKRVQSFKHIREQELGELMDSLSQLASTASPVNLSEMLLRYVANTTCRVAFGLSFRGSGIDNESFLEVFHEANAAIGKFAASDIFPAFGWVIDWITGLEARRDRSFRNLDAFYEQAIEDHIQNRKPEEGREDLIDVLLKMQSEGLRLGSDQLTKNHIKAILMDIFLAGVDTSSITMDWVMAELIKNPRVLKKVQAEIRECIGDKGTVSHEDVEGLTYLRMVIKEAWRLHAVGPLLIPREATTKFQVNGYNIYPGTRIQVNVWAIGRNPDVWKDPEEFTPERFIDNDVDPKGTNFQLLPFGGGRRGCPGMIMGITIVEYTLANLLYRFDWKLPEGMKPEDVSMEEAPGLTIHRKDPLQVIPVNYR